MKIYNRIIWVFLSGVILCTGSCTGNYEDMNRNPYDVTDKEMERDGYNITSALLNMQNNVISTDVNKCQYMECLLGGPWGGYFSDSNEAWTNKMSTYNASDSWTMVFFTSIIPKLYPAYSRLQRVTDDAVPLSVGAIIKVAAMHRVTDTYGPIPYSKIGEDGKLQVAFDSQEEVYDRMFEELDQAIGNLTAHRQESLVARADLIYGGDLDKWVKYANSLKLRLAMRIVYADEEKAQMMAEQAVHHEIGVMKSNGDNAALRTFGVDGNPINKAVKYNDGDSRVNADIASYMNGYEDPRREAYFLKSKFADPACTYCGLRSGITIPASGIFTQYSEVNINNSSPLLWMNSSEVAFLMAEGALRGWDMGCAAKDLYEEGIKRSFDQWKVAGVDGYMNDASRTPGIYKDPYGTFSVIVAPSDITVMWNEADGFEKSLERIIVQKWIANWTLGNEAWAERRRTGYPRLMPVIVNGSQGVLPNNDDIPRRCSYPVDEYSSNSANVKAAVSMLGGPDNIGTRVWWDCKK